MLLLSKKERLKKKAFTLMELMVTIIIIGILAAMAIPMFPRAMEATRAKQAIAALKQIRTAQRLYRTKEDFYYPHWEHTDDLPTDEVECIERINEVLFKIKVIDTRDQRNWNFNISNTVEAGNTFTATATRKDGTKTITIDQVGEITIPE